MLGEAPSPWSSVASGFSMKEKWWETRTTAGTAARQLVSIYRRGRGDPSHRVSVGPVCVDSGSKRRSSPWSSWDCVDQTGGASSEPGSQGCGAPGSLLCAVYPRAPRQAISPCPVFALEVGDVGKCGLQGPHHLTCAGSPALGSQAEALVSPGNGLALWPQGWECADGQASGGFAGRVATKVCFLPCLELNASA